MLRGYRDRKWDSILTATPCDLWRFIRGRTLWVMGDSQSLDLFKALQCFLHELAGRHPDPQAFLKHDSV